MSTTNNSTTTRDDLEIAAKRFEAAQWRFIHIHWMRTKDAAELAAATANYTAVKAAYEQGRLERIAIRKSVKIEDRNARAYNRFAAIARKRAAAAPEPESVAVFTGFTGDAFINQRNADANETNRAHWTAEEWRLLELFGTAANVRDYLDWLVSAEPAPADTSAGLHAPYLPELWDAMSYYLNAWTYAKRQPCHRDKERAAWREVAAQCGDNDQLLIWADAQIRADLAA